MTRERIEENTPKVYDGVEAERLPNRRVAVEVALQSGEDAVDVGLSDGLRVFTSTAIEPIFSVRSERAGFVGDSLRDGLLAKSGLGLRAGAAGHTRKSPRAIDKSSAAVGADSTTTADREVRA